MTPAQEKNVAWVLPRPKPDKYPGGMPLHCEGWLIKEAEKILGKPAKLMNLFCGMNQFGYRVDIKPEVDPDAICDAHEVSKLHPPESFNLILADPPYSNLEAKELYGTGKLKYKTWTSECTKLLEPKGLLIVFHKYLMPNPDPKFYKVVRRVFIGFRPFHLPRIAIYFQKGE